MQRKQQWYQTNQINMSREDEQEYLEYCADAMFRIHILELRLNRYLNWNSNKLVINKFLKLFYKFWSHKEVAPVKYQEMEQKLRNDPRLTFWH